MARLFVFDCKCGDYKKVERVEYTQPTNASIINAGRYKIDLSAQSNHTGYPQQTKTCPKCGLIVYSQEFEIGKVPPVFFNYMGDND